jgi:hypothetical protein
LVRCIDNATPDSDLDFVVDFQSDRFRERAFGEAVVL